MTILNALRKLPHYNYYENKINQVLSELLQYTNSVDGDNDSLILRRFEPLFQAAEVDAAQAYNFLLYLKNIIISAANLGSHEVPALNALSPRGRAIKLLDKYCPIHYLPLVSVLGNNIDTGSYLDLSPIGKKLYLTDLQNAKIYLDEADFWFASDQTMSPGDESLMSQERLANEARVAKGETPQVSNHVLNVSEDDKVVDFTFINNYLLFAQLVKAYPFILSLPAKYFTPIGLTRLQQQFSRLNIAQDKVHVTTIIEQQNAIFSYDDATSAAAIRARAGDSDESVSVNAVPADLKERILAGDFSPNLSSSLKAQALLAELKIAATAYKSSKSYRQRAQNQLLEAIRGGDIHAVNQLILTRSFREDGGLDKSHRWHGGELTDGCKQFQTEFAQFVTKNRNDTSAFVSAVIRNDQLLYSVLADDAIYQKLAETPDLLTEIYTRTAFKSAFVQAIYDRRRDNLPALSLPNGAVLTYPVVVQMLTAPANASHQEQKAEEGDVASAAQWNAFNKLRHHYRLASIVPANVLHPRANNRAAIDELTPEQKHQLIDSDIAVGEDYLRKKYKHLFINIVKGNNANQASASSAVNNNNVPRVFFMPISNYMLFEPTNTRNVNFGRYRDFKKALPEYVNSAPSHGKPVVFTGVANVSGNHYIAYFVYKKPDGKVQVVTLDPSPQTYLSGTKSRRGELLDGKDKAIQKLHSIFGDIFPGCEYTDLNVTQQLLQRDCGFNALQTLDDVLSSLDTENPMLQINADSNLTIDTTGLTVNGNVDRGINYSNGTYYYQQAFKAAGEANRQKWVDRFKAIRYRPFYFKESTVNSIAVSESIIEQGEEYSFVENTRLQQHADAGDESLSVIFGHMVSTPLWQVVEASFIQNLQEPTLQQLTELAKSVTTAMGGQSAVDGILPANQDLTAVLQELSRDALYQHLVRALAEKFKAYLQSGRLKITEGETAKSLQDQFVNHANIKDYYARLSSKEKNTLLRDVVAYADNQIKDLKAKVTHNQKQIEDEIVRVVDVLITTRQKLVQNDAFDAAMQLDGYFVRLVNMKSSFNVTGLSVNDSLKKEAYFQRVINEYKLQFVAYLTSLYSAEDVMPHPQTRVVRQAIAALMNLSLSRYATDDELIAFDRRVNAELVRNHVVGVEPLAASVPSLFISASVPVRNSLVPNTYGRPVTRALLIKLLDFWKIQYRDNTNSNLTPVAIMHLIQIVNEIPADIADDNEVPVGALARLRTLVESQVKFSDFANFANADVTQKVFLAILNTKSLSLLNAEHVPMLSALSKSVQEDKQVAPELSIKTVEHVLNLFTGKDKHDPKNPEDFGAVNSSQLADTASGSLAKTLFGSGKSNDGAPVAVILQTLCQAFRSRRCNLTGDFSVDVADLQSLIQFLSNYRSIKVGAKLETPKDRLYWAIASLVSDALKQHGVAIAAAQLLGIYPDMRLVSTTIPDSIAGLYGFDKGASVNCISPQDLVCLEPGYFLDMGWLTARYEANGELINPYTGERLTGGEVAALMNGSPALKEALSSIYEGRTTSKIEKHIHALINLVNGLLDPEGRWNNTTDQQTKAWTVFYEYVESLRLEDRKGLMGFEVVPLTNSTCADQGTGIRVRLETVLRGDTCSHVISKCLVPLIYQYRGNLSFLNSYALQVYHRYDGMSALNLGNYFERKQIDKLPSPTLADGYIRQALAAAAPTPSLTVPRMLS